MYEVFERLLELKGVSTAEVSKATGIPKSTLSSWKNGVSTPKADKLYLIAQFFDVPMEVFFADDSDRILAEQYQLMKDRYADVKMEGFSPVFDVAAGNGRINGDYADEYVEEENDGEHVWLKVCGDSMYPILHDGDCIKVHIQTETDKADLTVIKVDGETATVKYVEVTDNGVWLRAENKDVFSDTFYTAREIMTLPVTIVGRVTELRRSF